MSEKKISIIGGGLAGVEAAYQAAKRGVAADVYEMRPLVATDAHTTGFLGELVCSNSLGAIELSSSAGLLKEELKRLDSFFLRMAEKYRVPAGGSLSVDRIQLAQAITSEIQNIPGVTVIREEIRDIPNLPHPVIIASGPLTSAPLAEAITRVTQRKNLFFYDATSPIINAASINYDKVWMASRYDKGDADFINIPLNEEQYRTFVAHIIAADQAEMSDADKHIYFDACLPIEEIARRGELSLAFGPMKPVGLSDPHTGLMPFAVIQLRQDDLNKNFFQMVGFQTRMKWGDQKRIFSQLPGLENAEFERFGRMHRNTYVNAPLVLDSFCQCKLRENLYFAGQISGVEGYVESVSSGLLAGIFAASAVNGLPRRPVPENTAVGSLIHYITHANWQDFRPSKFTFGLLPDHEPISRKKSGGKRANKERKSLHALESLESWISNLNS